MAPWAPWVLRGVRASACSGEALSLACWGWRPSPPCELFLRGGGFGSSVQGGLEPGLVSDLRALTASLKVCFSEPPACWVTTGRQATGLSAPDPRDLGWRAQLLPLRSCWRRGGHLPRKAQGERCPRAAGSGVGLGGAPELDRVGSSSPAVPPTGCVTLDKSLHLSVPPRPHL